MFKVGDKVKANLLPLLDESPVFTIKEFVDDYLGKYAIPEEDISYLVNEGVHVSVLELVSTVEPSVIDDQTIMFWNLQLQFMEMHEQVIGKMFLNGIINGVMAENRHTQKMVKLANRAIYDGLSEADRLCLATHLALQLSGLA